MNRRSAVTMLFSAAVLVGVQVGSATRAQADPICTGTPAQYTCIGEVGAEGEYFRCDANYLGFDCRVIYPEVEVLR